jgi:thioredoxin reductase (NADPH)
MGSMSDNADRPPLVRIFGTSGSALCYTIRDFLWRSDVPFEWVQLKTDQQARELAGVDALNDSRLPVCVFLDGTRLQHPTLRQITEKLGWLHDPQRAEYDLAIYGAGPAGLSAAVYAASEGLKTIVIERFAIGGQAGSTSSIENYLGFPDGVSGAELAERARRQACRFGAEMLVGTEGIRGELLPGKTLGYLTNGAKIVARTALCATGVEYRRLQLPNEERFFGAGIYYGAGLSEASLCAGDHVFVVGGGNSAAQAALHFSRFARRVTMVVRDDSLRVTISQYLIDRIGSTSNIEGLTRTEVTALHGDERLEAISLTDRRTGKEQVLPTRWLFVCIGGNPRTEWAIELGIVRDGGGYLVTGPDLLRDGRLPQGWPLDRHPYYLETNIPGIFVAGDVRHGSVKRCAAAVGEGAMALTFVQRYLSQG